MKIRNIFYQHTTEVYLFYFKMCNADVRVQRILIVIDEFGGQNS